MCMVTCRRYLTGSGVRDGLMVEGGTYGCVKTFCYLGDTFDGNGADLAATFRITNGWMKF